MLLSSQNTFTEMSSILFGQITGQCSQPSWHIKSTITISVGALLSCSWVMILVNYPQWTPRTVSWALFQSCLLQTGPSHWYFKFTMAQMQLYFPLPTLPFQLFLVFRIIVNGTPVQLGKPVTWEDPQLPYHLCCCLHPPPPAPKEMLHWQQCLYSR